ncbi:hypothetical protein B0T11DRAFT_286037 [Plectosphaerella cucumerina]|uniref:Secreted protein n=1 Tax=Plectosphaerella cucumerina TaxID=40658 RepID=A0A8K0TEQ3_9PEZI|nr:hypothetical protein B0T11DRAFT_286037 [Plectosphaerella cucumerina]
MTQADPARGSRSVCAASLLLYVLLLQGSAVPMLGADMPLVGWSMTVAGRAISHFCFFPPASCCLLLELLFPLSP